MRAEAHAGGGPLAELRSLLRLALRPAATLVAAAACTLLLACLFRGTHRQQLLRLMPLPPRVAQSVTGEMSMMQEEVPEAAPVVSAADGGAADDAKGGVRLPWDVLRGNLAPLKLGPSASFVYPKGRPTCGVVWMHGLGDTEDGWTDLLEDNFAPLLAKEVGPCRFLLPRAPVQQVTCNNNDRTTSWFDMRKLPLRASDAPPDHKCSLEQALASCGRVHEAIDQLIEEGIPPERIIVGGFSQGGAMSLLSTLTYKRRLAGIVVFSGLVFFREHLAQLLPAHSEGYQVFWGHGSKDDILHVSLQVEGVQALTDVGLRVTAKQYPVKHSAHPQEMEDAAVFCTKLLAA